MLIKTLPVGHLETNCYIVTDEMTRQCAVIDPGDESNTILNYIEENHLTVRDIFLTHGHFDHTGVVETVAEETGARVHIHAKALAEKGEADPYKFTPRNITVSEFGEGDEFSIDALTFHVLETPGHAEGAVALMCGNALFTGDTLFRDSCGRTDLPGGDMQMMLRSLRRLSAIEGDLEVYPGHGDVTSLERERQFNYYMKYAVGVKK